MLSRVKSSACSVLNVLHALLVLFNTQLWSSGSANRGWFMINDKPVCKLHFNIPCKAHQERVKLHHNDAACSSSRPSKQWHLQYKEPLSHCSTPTHRTTAHPLWPTTSVGLITLSPRKAPAKRQSTLLSQIPMVNQLSLHVWTAKVTSKNTKSSYKTDQLTCFQKMYLAVLSSKSYYFYPIDKLMFSCLKYKSKNIFKTNRI